jgi:hypothetical protein
MRPSLLLKLSQDSSFDGVFAQAVEVSVYANQVISKEYRNVICKVSFMTNPSVVYAKRDFYLLKAINEQIDIYKTSGLIDYWHSFDVDQRILNEKEPNHPKALKLQSLVGTFQILMFGLALGFVFFCCEFSLYRVSRNHIHAIVL